MTNCRIWSLEVDDRCWGEGSSVFLMLHSLCRFIAISVPLILPLCPMVAARFQQKNSARGGYPERRSLAEVGQRISVRPNVYTIWCLRYD